MRASAEGGLEARAGLCARCEHVRIVTNDRGSQFVRCNYATIDARYPKYPRLPVLRCEAFAAGRRGDSPNYRR